MQPPANIKVREFEWDEENLEHLRPHGVTLELAEEIKDGAPLFFLNRPGRGGTHMMIGPDDSGRFWTIILVEAGAEGRWRPITGWPSDNPEIRWYNEAT